jgi:hypothetical protein
VWWKLRQSAQIRENHFNPSSYCNKEMKMCGLTCYKITSHQPFKNGKTGQAIIQEYGGSSQHRFQYKNMIRSTSIFLTFNLRNIFYIINQLNWTGTFYITYMSCIQIWEAINFLSFFKLFTLPPIYTVFMEWNIYLQNSNIIVPVGLIYIVLVISPLSNSVHSTSFIVSIGSCTNAVVGNYVSAKGFYISVRVFSERQRQTGV